MTYGPVRTNEVVTSSIRLDPCLTHLERWLIRNGGTGLFRRGLLFVTQRFVDYETHPLLEFRHIDQISVLVGSGRSKIKGEMTSNSPT